MNVAVRMLRDSFAALAKDLRRPHPFACERVGFLFARYAQATPGQLLMFPTEYDPVRDEEYVADESVGATFNTTAIRRALQRSRTSGCSCLQVHLHDHTGHTRFSRVDRKTIDELALALRVVAPLAPHGGLVLSYDSATARIWVPGQREPAHTQVTIVGFPMSFGPESQ